MQCRHQHIFKQIRGLNRSHIGLGRMLTVRPALFFFLALQNGTIGFEIKGL
jgi:hypothetical protein